MKQALLILGALALGMAQTSAAAESYTLGQSSANFGSSNNTYSYSSTYGSSNGSRISSDDEISQAIQNLSSQAQQKEDRLATLAQKLTTQQQYTQQYSAPAVLSSSSAPAIAAARASRAAHARSTGRCAQYVRKALQSAGYEFTPNPSAYQYATRGTLAKAGFVKVSNGMAPQVGDVVVYDRSSKHRHGHIQIFDGSSWVSDFRQDDISPYSGSYAYTTWRDSRYLDDASNRGIYLAMAED
jgi:hypothetical protein